MTCEVCPRPGGSNPPAPSVKKEPPSGRPLSSGVTNSAAVCPWTARAGSRSARRAAGTRVPAIATELPPVVPEYRVPGAHRKYSLLAWASPWQYGHPSASVRWLPRSRSVIAGYTLGSLRPSFVQLRSPRALSRILIATVNAQLWRSNL